MEIVTLKSKIKLGCNLCDKCCINRGDIRVTPVNVCRISKYLGITIEEFLNTYTNRLYDESLETVIKAHGENFECMLYNHDEKKCSIHPVKPMQCVMFPLVPESLKNDYFYNNNQCDFIPSENITVNDWLNGNNKIYSKNKNICIKWIKFIEEIEPKLREYKQEDIDKIYNFLYINYNIKRNNYIKELERNMDIIRKKIKN